MILVIQHKNLPSGLILAIIWNITDSRGKIKEKILLYRYKRTIKVYTIKNTYVNGVDKVFFKLMQNFIKKPNLITWMALICDLTLRV